MNTPTINIQIDENALRQQIEQTLDKALLDAAIRLRLAADSLDRGEWWESFSAENAKRLRAEYERGYEDARAEAKS